jgi:hypothetical protein
MMWFISKLNIKLILGHRRARFLTLFGKKPAKWAFLAFFAVFGVFACLKTTQAVEGNPLTYNEVWTYAEDGSLILNFTAKKDFTIDWGDGTWGSVLQNPYYLGGIYPYGKFRAYSPDFIVIGGHQKVFLGTLALFQHMDDNDLYYDTENFLQDQNYTAYFLNISPLWQPYETGGFDTIADLLDYTDQNDGSVRNIGNEVNLDAESILTLSELDGGTWYEHDVAFSEPPSDDITISDPVSGSTKSSAFTMTADFTNADGYNQIMFIFENWDATSTCPDYGTQEWTDEYPLYFNYQSAPYFSPTISTTTASTTIFVDELIAGEYNCNKCYFIDGAGAMSDAFCHDYTLTISEYISATGTPSHYTQIDEWAGFYSENSDKWATSTELFNSLAVVIDPVMVWIGNLSLSFSSLFDASTTANKGQEYGEAIPVLRGYLVLIDGFFGGVPISGVFFFYILISLLVIVFKLITGLIHLIKP